MNAVINISMVIVGLVLMAFPPVGVAFLAFALGSSLVRKRRKEALRSRLRAERLEQVRRARILAFKAL